MPTGRNWQDVTQPMSKGLATYHFFGIFISIRQEKEVWPGGNKPISLPESVCMHAIVLGIKV